MSQSARETPAGVPQQFLTFTLGPEEYGVAILKIQEIKGYSAITPLPNAPAYVKGVLNLRGTIVPVVDLRAKFGLSAVADLAGTVIVVVQVAGQTIGVLADAVSDVLTVAGPDIQPPPDLHGQVDTRCLTGLAKAGEKLVLLLDIEQVLGASELAAVQASACN